MIGRLQSTEYNYPHGLFGIIGSSVSKGGWNFEDDLTASTNWTLVGNNTYDATNDEIDYTLPATSANGNAYADPMGSTVSDTAFVALLAVRFDTLSTGDACGSGQHCFGMSDQSGANFDTVQDALFVGVWNKGLYSVDADGVDATGALGTAFQTAITVKKYWMLLTRQSATTFDIDFYPDATLTTADYSNTETIVSTIINLRYMNTGTKRADVGVCSNDSSTGSLESAKFANGVTTPPA